MKLTSTDIMGLDGPVDGNLDMMSDPAAGGPMGGRGPGGLDDLTDIRSADKAYACLGGNRDTDSSI